MAIFIDGDACPVKDEVYTVAARYRLPVTLVANRSLFVPARPPVSLVVVGDAPDAVDDWIAGHVGPGDVVVTADIPLASRCLVAGAQVLGTDGRPFSEDSIGSALAIRDLKAQLRDAGIASRGPGAIGAKERSRFLAKLDLLVQRARVPRGAS